MALTESTDGASWREPSQFDGRRFGAKTNPPRSRLPSFAPVGAIQRGIQILRSLNHLGIGTVADIHKETGIPKPTIVRVLETLIFDGYVARDSMCSGYYVTSKISELCPSRTGMAHLMEVARPIVVALTERILWPVNIGSLVNDEIVVLYSTAEISPWARTIIVGKRVDPRHSSMGRAYLAFCREPERRRLIAASREPDDDGVAEQALLDLLARVRQCGFASRSNHTSNRISSVAVPLILRGELLAVLTCHYFDRVVAPARAVADIVPALSGARDEIVRALEESSAVEAADPGVTPAAGMSILGRR